MLADSKSQLFRLFPQFLIRTLRQRVVRGTHHSDLDFHNRLFSPSRTNSGSSAAFAGGAMVLRTRAGSFCSLPHLRSVASQTIPGIMKTRPIAIVIVRGE